VSTLSLVENRAPAYVQALDPPLSIDELRRRTPAVFAEGASGRTKPSYRFIDKCCEPHLLINVATAHMWRTS